MGLGYYQGKLSPPLVTGEACPDRLGEDYHRVVGAKLTLLQDFLQREVPGSRNLAFVDTGPLLDKEVARRAGLGWFGKNTLLLTRLGSWVVLGGILTTIELPPTSPQGKDCGACDLCLRACPTGALLAPGVLDPDRCLSCLTQQKGFFPWSCGGPWVFASMAVIPARRCAPTIAMLPLRQSRPFSPGGRNTDPSWQSFWS